jgi:diacylglycerol kinase
MNPVMAPVGAREPKIDLQPASPPLKQSRSWRTKFGDAFRGMKFGIRGHSSFFVHFFCAAVVLATALALGCTVYDWAILLLCIGLVLMAELFNSAIETLFRGQGERVKTRTHRALDVAAGAVLLASMVAAVVGLIIFLHRLAVLLDWDLANLGW